MFVGLCAEFGLLSHLDDNPGKAFSGIREVVAFAVKTLDEDGAPIPEALSLVLTAVPPIRPFDSAKPPPQKRQIVAFASLSAALTNRKPAAKRPRPGTGPFNRPHQSRPERLFRHVAIPLPPSFITLGIPS